MRVLISFINKDTLYIDLTEDILRNIISCIGTKSGENAFSLGNDKGKFTLSIVPNNINYIANCDDNN